ncbi:hypothetical protein ACIBG8_20890 [Nonomuraea sp. NPDC050556]|uniref:hypothetical protein n=1 Tax=Nonomuraea sp. NPDC050556 TaxID=3364369 RepID=UPI00378F7267
MRWLVAAVAMIVLAGCSGSPEVVPTQAAPKPSTTATTMAPDKLADLSLGLEGKVLLKHADPKGEEPSWSSELRVAKGYRLHLHCIPGEVVGDIVTKVGSTRFTDECGGEPSMHEVDVSGGQRSVAVVVPSGAKWAVLVEAKPA